MKIRHAHIAVVMFLGVIHALCAGCGLKKTPSASVSTELLAAAWNGRIEFAESLLQQGVDVNFRDQYDATPLIYAAYRNQPGVMAALLSHQADVAAQDQFGMTALMQAARYNAPLCVRLLLNANADIEAREG